MLTEVTVTFDLADWVGDDLDPRRTKGWITTNVDSGFVVDKAANKIRIDDARVTINPDGTGSATVWAPGADGNPASWQTTFHFDVPRNGRRDRKLLTLGPFTITTGGDLADLIAEQYAPPSWQSAFTTDMETLRDETRAARDEANARVVTDLGTSDGQVSTLLATPGSLSRAAHLQVLNDEFLPLVVMGAI